MKAKVYVTLKSGVLDPQSKAIQHSVELLGYGQQYLVEGVHKSGAI